MKRTSSVLDSSNHSDQSPTQPYLFKSLSLTEKKDDARCQERLGFINQRLNSLQNPFLKEKPREINVMHNIQINPENVIRANTLPATTTTTNDSSQVSLSLKDLHSKIFNLSLSLGDAFTRHANISATMSAQPKPRPAFHFFESQQTPPSFNTQSYEEPPQLEVERKLIFTQEKENITSVEYKEYREEEKSNSNPIPIIKTICNPSSKHKPNPNPKPSNPGVSSAKKKVVVKPYGPPKHKWTQKEVAILYELLEAYPIYKMKPADMGDMAKDLTSRFSKAGIKTLIKREELIAKIKEEMSKAQKKIDYKNEVYKGYNDYIYLNIGDNDEAKE